MSCFSCSGERRRKKIGVLDKVDAVNPFFDLLVNLESFCVDNTGAAFIVVDLVDIVARIREDELKGKQRQK